jgi:dolichol-phosphate mannosyltransferase
MKPRGNHVPVTVVVPMLNAATRIDALHRSVRAYLDEALPGSEILLVDDGSSDQTWSRIGDIAARDPFVSGVRLDVNVGQVGAMCAGFSRARGDVVVTMDDDLDCDPSEIGNFVDAVNSGADFASGWRRGARSPVRALGSWCFNARVRQLGFPLHDAGCGLNALTRDLARQVAVLGWDVRMHRIKLVMAQMTDDLVEVEFTVRPTSGSHYGLRRLAAAWLDTELTFGSLTSTGVRLLGVAAPCALAGIATPFIVAPGMPRSTRWWAAAAAATCVTTTIGTLSVLDLLRALDQRSLAEPAFQVGSVTGLGAAR